MKKNQTTKEILSVDKLQTQIMNLQAKIAELQKQCNHKDFEVAFYSWRPGAMNPSHICVKCRMYLGEATSEESSKLWHDSGFLDDTTSLSNINIAPVNGTTVTTVTTITKETK